MDRNNKSLFLALLWLLACSNASPVPRSVATVLTSLNTAANEYQSFQSAVNAFNGQSDLFDAIYDGENAVEKALQTAIQSSRDSDLLDANESKQVMNALAQPYPTFMEELLHDITAKEPQVNLIGRRPDMLGYLQNLKSLSDQLPMVLEGKVDQTDANELEDGRQWAGALFADALQVYSS